MKRLNVFSTNNNDTSTVFKTAQGWYIDHKFDLHASGGANVLGYGNPAITTDMKEFLDVANTSFWKLKHEIWEVFEPQLDYITDNRYASFVPALTGSDAVDNALRIIWWYWHNQGQTKNTILVRKNSYHSGSISGWQMVHDHPFAQAWPKIEFVEFFDDLEQTVERIGAENIAGVLVDTVPWKDGLTSYSQEYWTKFQEVVDKNQLLLCVDEILTGIGRLGYWLHSHQLGLKPNMVLLGKALTSGHDNLGLTILDAKVTDVVQHQWLALGNTRSTNTMGAVAACSTLMYMIENNTLDTICNSIIPHIKEVESILQAHGFKTVSQGTMLQADIKDFTAFQHKLNTCGLYHNWDRFWHLSFYNIGDSEMSMVKDKLLKALK